MRENPDKVRTFRERMLEMVNDAFAIGRVDSLPEKIKVLLETKDQKLPKERTWVFDPGELEIEVTFEWDAGLCTHLMNARLKVVDKGTILPSSCIFTSSVAELDLTKGYWNSKLLRGRSQTTLLQEVETYHEEIRKQYAELIEPGELEVCSDIYPTGGTFSTMIWIEKPGWFRRRMIFARTDNNNLDEKIDPFHEGSDISTSLHRNCRSKETAEQWIVRVTRKLEKRHTELSPA